MGAAAALAKDAMLGEEAAAVFGSAPSAARGAAPNREAIAFEWDHIAPTAGLPALAPAFSLCYGAFEPALSFC